MFVDSFMTKNVVFVKENTLIYEAMELLIQHKISGLPVVDGEMNLKGLLTEKDVLSILSNPKVGIKDSVEYYMSKDIISFTEKATAADICQFFIKSHIRRVPIVRDGKLVGIVSRRDIIEVIIKSRNDFNQSVR